MSQPTWFDNFARLKWAELHPLREDWKTHELDQLAAYCAAYSRWRRAETYLAEPTNGPVITISDDDGNVKTHGAAPEIKVAADAAKEMARIAKLLRLARLQTQ